MQNEDKILFSEKLNIIEFTLKKKNKYLPIHFPPAFFIFYHIINVQM